MPTYPVTLASWSTMAVQYAPVEVSEVAKVDQHGISCDAAWQVYFNGLFSSIALADYAPSIGLPTYGNYFSSLSGTLYVSNIGIDLVSGAMPNPDPSLGQLGVALYKATYSPITAERLDLNPLARPAQIEGGGIDLTEVRRVDVNGKPIINSVGDFFEGLPNFYIQGYEFSISMNLASNPASLAGQYSFSQNSATWYSVAQGAGMMGKVSFRKVIEKYAGTDVTYYPTTFPIRIRTDTNLWQFVPLNYGYRYYPNTTNSPGNLTNFIDPSGVHGPCFLANNGTLLNPNGSASPTAPIVYPAASGSGPGGYQVLQGTDWNGLGLPNPFDL